MTKLRTAGRPAKVITTLLALLATGLLLLGIYAVAAQGLSAPTLSQTPANPTNQTSATFAYTSKDKNITFQCALDSPIFSACGTSSPATTTYAGPLTAGSHTFSVKTVSSSQTSPVTSFTWMIDVTYPTVSSITRTASSPTNASSVSWAVAFSESVTGVDATDFQLVVAGLGGSPAITTVSGSAASYTVSASTGTGQGMLTLNLVDNDSIRDSATNRLGGTGNGNGNFSGPGYAIDKLAPPAPIFTEVPDDPNPTTETTFRWTDAEGGVFFDCSKENGAWVPCSTPYTFTVSGNSQHQFSVRARDAAGNVSGPADYKWKVDKVVFGISGSATDLTPGVWRPINVTFTNPNNPTIYVYELTVSVTSSPASCSASTNLEILQAPLTSSHTAAVPGHGTAALANGDRPMIRLKNLSTNQDACKNASFSLSFTGTATK